MSLCPTYWILQRSITWIMNVWDSFLSFSPLWHEWFTIIIFKSDVRLELLLDVEHATGYPFFLSFLFFFLFMAFIAFSFTFFNEGPVWIIFTHAINWDLQYIPQYLQKTMSFSLVTSLGTSMITRLSKRVPRISSSSQLSALTGGELRFSICNRMSLTPYHHTFLLQRENTLPLSSLHQDYGN